MKKTVFIFICLFTILTVAKAQKVVKVGAFNFYPAIFQDTDGVVKGFYIDALNELGEKENIKFIYVYGSWNEGLERIKNGEVDLLTSVAITEERLNFMDYTTIPLLTVWSEVYRSQKSEINGVLDLEGKTIAVMKSDLHGAYIKNLTEKLSVNCSFVETTDFEEVFKLISNKKVDAGVVSNTFGVTKSEEYGLLSCGVILNPFDIFFTVKKGSNIELLKLMDKYLYLWKHDRNSVFNVSRQKWSHGKVDTIEIFPKWLQKGIYSALLIVLALIVFVALLRYRVRVSTEKAKYNERIFETFMDNTPAYVYIKDENLKHIYRNKMVNNVNRVAPNDKTRFERKIAELVEKTDNEILSLEKEQTNLQYQCKLDGKIMWLHDFKFNLKLPNGNPAIGGISFDITKLKETQFELIRAKERAEESDRLKSAFLANMSHEIRTPMNGILGFTDLLQDGSLSGETKKDYVDIIKKSGDRLLSTVNDIIEISKIESGDINVTKSKVDIIGHLDTQVTFFIPEAKKKNIDILVQKNIDGNELTIKTDKNKFSSILSNLIKNAIKYTNEGTIKVGLKIENKQLLFSCKDTGIGIPKSRLGAIFNHFEQADVEDKQVHEGSGLGLAIVKTYVEMLDGKIWVESEEGKGSTFYVSLPYKHENKNEQIIPQEVKSSDSGIKNIKVLIAEDDEISSMHLSAILNDKVKKIISAENGIEAINEVKNDSGIDLILMDMKMPKMDGMEATKQIREFNKDVIIIAQTAYALEGNKEKALDAGCNDYISKPIKKDKLFELINKYF